MPGGRPAQVIQALEDEWLIIDDERVDDDHDHIRAVRAKSDTSVRHKRLKCFGCKKLSQQLSRTAAERAAIEAVFFREHADHAVARAVRQTTLEEFRIGNIPSDTRIRDLQCKSTDLLMRFVASANLSFREAAGSDLWEFIWSLMQLAQAACPGIPRASPMELFQRLSRDSVAREFGQAAQQRSQSASQPFRKVRIIGVSLDAVTIWGRRLLAITIMNALLRGIAPLLVQVCGDFAGTLDAYAEALRGTLKIASEWDVEIAGFVCDGLAAQANSVDPNHESCFFSDIPPLSGAFFAWCGCHLIQLALRDAMAECPNFAQAAKVIDKGVEILRSKPIVQEIKLVVPAPVASRWAAKINTISFIERHPAIPNQICGAVLQWEDWLFDCSGYG
jgi:hypothetical protein